MSFGAEQSRRIRKPKHKKQKYEGKLKIISFLFFQFIYTKVGVEQVRHFST
jgi:hypothetical protein